MQKKKVLVWETLATVSGGQKMTLTVMDMLSDKFEFCCLIPAEGMMSEELKRRNIPYVLMGDQTLPTGVKGKQVIFRYGWMSVKNVWKSLGAIRKYKPDILYAPGPAALPWSAVCGTLARKPVIWHLHHIFLDGATKKLLNLCGRWKSVREIIAVSNCVGDQIVNEVAHKKVKVLYNPVDVEKYANGDATKIIVELEAKLGRKFRGVKIVTQIGAITKNKRQNVLISVIANLKNFGEDVVGLIVGDTVTEADRIFKRELEQQIEESGIKNQVVWMGFRSDIGDILAATDCVFVPSEEGLSLVAMEAMSAKRQVVTMNSSGAYELLNHAGCGTFYKEDDESGVTNAVKKVLETPNAEDPQLHAVKKAILNALGDGFSEIRVKVTEEDAELIVIKKELELAFYQLSEGEKSVIALVGDLSRRLAIANPKRENPLEGDGIVLIDEIDLHLHPKWQEKIFPALQNTFPNIQFIVSTHAPKVLESVDENIQVIRLHEDAETHLVLAEPMEPMNGWDVNTILEDYMDTEVYNRKTTELLEQINVYLNEKAYDEAEKLVNKLAWMTSEENTKVVRARILIAKGR